MIAIIILICLTITVVLMFIIAYKRTNKKYKSKIEQAERDEQKLSDILSVTNQHEKYTKNITIQTVITNIAEFFIMLSTLLLIVLPIFKIESEITDITIAEKNFSFFSTYIALIKEYDKSAHFYTDVDVSSSEFIICCFGLLIFVIATIICLICIPFKIKNNSKNVYINIKLDKKGYIDKFGLITDLFFLALVIYCWH